MPDGSDYSSPSNIDLLDILDPDRDTNETEFVPDILAGTTGSPLYDFIGQAVWKAADESTLGSLGAFDAVSESVKGSAADTWEEMIAGESAGDWEELSSAGKAGAMVGGALGMIPQFFAGGLIAKGLVKGGFKISEKVFGLSSGAKIAAAKSTAELIAAGKKLPIKKALMYLNP